MGSPHPAVRTDVRTDVRNTDAGRKPRSVRISVCEIRVTDVRRPYGRGTSAPTIPHNAPRVSTAQTLRDSFRCTQTCSISTVQTGYRHLMSLALRILCRAPPLRTTVRVQSARDHRHGGGGGWFQRRKHALRRRRCALMTIFFPCMLSASEYAPESGAKYSSIVFR